MEGTLERKQRLQQGGKKVRDDDDDEEKVTTEPPSAALTLILFSQAASRGWNSYYAVLSSHTMCFFQDGKDALRVGGANESWCVEARRAW